jgi:hypothetical protein
MIVHLGFTPVGKVIAGINALFSRVEPPSSRHAGNLPAFRTVKPGDDGTEIVAVFPMGAKAHEYAHIRKQFDFSFLSLQD